MWKASGQQSDSTFLRNWPRTFQRFSAQRRHRVHGPGHMRHPSGRHSSVQRPARARAGGTLPCCAAWLTRVPRNMRFLSFVTWPTGRARQQRTPARNRWPRPECGRVRPHTLGQLLPQECIRVPLDTPVPAGAPPGRPHGGRAANRLAHPYQIQTRGVPP